eukprot:351876-Chlamydomonas_euryale.AAC.3
MFSSPRRQPPPESARAGRARRQAPAAHLAQPRLPAPAAAAAPAPLLRLLRRHQTGARTPPPRRPARRARGARHAAATGRQCPPLTAAHSRRGTPAAPATVPSRCPAPAVAAAMQPAVARRPWRPRRPRWRQLWGKRAHLRIPRQAAAPPAPRPHSRQLHRTPRRSAQKRTSGGTSQSRCRRRAGLRPEVARPAAAPNARAACSRTRGAAGPGPRHPTDRAPPAGQRRAARLGAGGQVGEGKRQVGGGGQWGKGRCVRDVWAQLAVAVAVPTGGLVVCCKKE